MGLSAEFDGASVLYRAGSVYTPVDPRASAVVVEGGRVAWLGEAADAPHVDHVVDLGNVLVTPAFVDAHVHVTDAGLALDGLELEETADTAAILDAVAQHAKGSVGTIIGHGWGVAQPPTAEQLASASGGRSVYLARVDGHSAVCTPDVLALARGLDGFSDSGVVSREAHHVVRVAVYASMGRADRQRVQRLALEHAASLGIAAVHECGGPAISGEEDFTDLLTIDGAVPEVFGYWGELGAAAKARKLGAVGAGGDLFVDGALGSHTACLRAPYADGESVGHSYLSAEQIAAHVVDCVEHDMQAGFHAIGDEALSLVVAGFGLAASSVGVPVLRAGRHRVEHAEMLDKELIAAFVEFGLVASVQPAFDRLWGGAQGMYAQRLGAKRALDANPLGALKGVGVSLAFGSDAPVTPLDPWGAVFAAVSHHNPVHRLGVRAAFAAHTRGGWRAVRRDDEGVLTPGASATFAVWDTTGGLPEGSDGAPRCVRTVSRGRTIFEER